jgi:hypothetical protein
VKSLKGTLSSKTKRSNPAGAHSSSIRAGLARLSQNNGYLRQDGAVNIGRSANVRLDERI